ncbi:CLUMA_CG011168, isoform A [Clunio marinus]|uniref:CLUMA_CG011168, isoform A n=1 Tax=Clunio marinus TaxID=568069 RepID=A0A1J1IBY5_9DIPT|nr:CLUMA_CG011168, isoform A [Clunio marinus]
MKFQIFLVFLVSLFLSISTTIGIFLQNETNINAKEQKKLSPAEWTELNEDGLWSSLLEDWVLSNKNSPSRGREARIIQTVAPPQFSSHQQQSYQKYIPTSQAYLTKRIGESFDSEVNMKRPAQFNFNNQLPTPLKLQEHRQYQNSPREVSETDLYLLGAIEKLVYRVDYMEKRLKRTEQLVYYLMAGDNQKLEPEPCRTNFTKIGTHCYSFEYSNKFDWKTAAQKCKSLGSNLAEFEKIDEFRDVVAYILSHNYRGHDFWIGGLNPGLLWIWSTSARPINTNANLTSLSNKTESISKLPVKVVNQTSPKPQKNSTLSTSFPEITGNGRCLRLSYNPSHFSYGYTGHDCSSKQNFICISLDKTLDNEIKRISKKLNFED